MKTLEQEICEQATGCGSAGDYRLFAEQNGFGKCAVVDWTSSAGDWTFLVSADGEEWFLMSQTNNYPRSGFTRQIDTEEAFYGTEEEAMSKVVARYYV